MVVERKLVHEVSGWLRVYDDGSVDRTWTGPPEVKFMTESTPAHEHEFIDGVSVKDVTIDSKFGQKVRIYLPESTITGNNDVKKLPIIVHFHGGGFCVSQADWFMYYNIYTKLAKSAQAIVVSVYQRLAPENRLPAACDDGFSALMWLNSLAKAESNEPWLNEFGDFNRVFLIGDSSGGNIVHQVATRAGHVDLSPVRLAGAIPVHPGFARAKRSRSELEQAESPMLTLDMVDKFLALALPIGSTKDHPITCPMGAAMEELPRMPPVLLCLAENDLLMDPQIEYYEEMKKGNKDIEILNSPGMGHSFYLNKLAIDFDPNTGEATDALIQGIVKFIDKH
ncbi:hypothetical protein ACFE04_002154 [Oxalis oulophora]